MRTVVPSYVHALCPRAGGMAESRVWSVVEPSRGGGTAEATGTRSGASATAATARRATRRRAHPLPISECYAGLTLPRTLLGGGPDADKMGEQRGSNTSTDLAPGLALRRGRV